MTYAQQTSFIALFRILPAEAQMEKKSRVFRTDKALQKKTKISLLRGKVSKISSEEINNQLKILRGEWQRGI